MKKSEYLRLKKIEEHNLRKAEGIVHMPGEPEPLREFLAA